MIWLVAPLALLVTTIGALAGMELDAVRRRMATWQRLELRFGRDVTPEAVTGVLTAVAGLPRDGFVVLEVSADHEGVRYCLQGDQATVETLRGPLRALVPTLRLEAWQAPSANIYRAGRSLRLSGPVRSLRQDAVPEFSAQMLSALQPLAENERVLLRWRLAPGRPQQLSNPGTGQALEAEQRKHLRAKNAGAVLKAHGMVAAAAGHPARADHLVSRVTAVVRSRHTAYGHVRLLLRSGSWLRFLLDRRGLLFGDRYGVNELAGLLAWPVDAPALPGVSIGTSPQRLPSLRLPSRGRELGIATWPGAERRIYQSVVGGLSHGLFLGPTGVGKSTSLLRLMNNDLVAGRGLVLIDGKGDTARSLLEHVPERRHSDVICLDCAADGPQPGLKFLHGGSPELMADVVLGVLSDLFSREWGPLSERWLRAALVAVAHDPHGTLADTPFVFSDAAYRRKLVGRISDPLTKAAFAAFEAMSAGERQQQLAAPIGKLGQLLSRPTVRTMLGQADPHLDFNRALSGRAIVVVSLAPTRIGSAAARLVGALSVFALFQAVQQLAGLAPGRRRPVFAYLDEPQALGDLSMPLDTLLEQARGLGVGVTLAGQSVQSWPKSVREAALTNAATRLLFRQNSRDAALLAPDMAGISAEDLGDLAAFEAVARIGLGPGDIAPPVTIRTEPLPAAIADPVALQVAAASRYGQTLEDVDVALTKRHAVEPAGPVGRKARRS